MSSEASNRRSEGPDSVDALTLRLVVGEPNLDRFQPVIRRVSNLGVEFTTLAEEQQRPTLGDTYIGYTYLDPTHSSEGVLAQGWTGVRPEYRRQGIATALKVHGISLARQLGYAEIVTTQRIGNLSSIAMNQKVGFRPTKPEVLL
jgi:GNAT superfamily N-acetyltransferase